MTNEKYIGDVLLQKTFRSNCIDKKAKVNRGELPKYLVSNNHPPIIDRDTFNIVQVELARRCSKKSKSDFAQTDKDSFVEYDDITVRRLVECITVSNDGRIVVILKGGFREEEII